MPSFDDDRLDRWLAAGIIDEATAARIRAYEAADSGAQATYRWPVLLALAFGAMLVGAGVLLFISAHWDRISPTSRMLLVLLLVVVFHAVGAAARERFESMAVAMHTLGTIALGAGLALTGQVFHLYTQWPLGILLWAVGAGAAWLLLEQWPQAALLAVLGPLWLVVAWADHPAGWPAPSYAPVEVGCCILAFVYLSACFRDTRNAVREALVWVGAVALVPLVIMVCADRGAGTGSTESWAAWSLAMAIPMLLALVLRGELSVYNLAFTGWVAVLYQTKPNSVMQYAWLALGAVGLVAWGILERRVERLNLGVAGFAITVLTFYFSSVMDKLGRSASLVSLGILFLAGGYALERLRRRLVASIVREAAE